MTATLPTQRRTRCQRGTGDNWLCFDVHGIVRVAVAADAPTAGQIATMFAPFRSSSASPSEADLVLTGVIDEIDNLSLLENELAYDADTVRMSHAGVQLVRHGQQWTVQGSGELLTSVLPLVDLICVQRQHAMIHAATMEIDGIGVAMPAAGGTGKTSTIAKAMRSSDTAFMGDDWAFVSADGELFGYAKPMFIKPHHRPIYPHLFQGARKPLVPPVMSASVSRMTTIVHPVFARHPRMAAFSRRWSPEHRMVDPHRALPGSRIAQRAPLRLAVFVERWQGRDVRVSDRSRAWMAARMLGNWHIEMARHSRDLLTALGASGVVPLDEIFAAKAAALRSALTGAHTTLLRVPVSMSADQASDEIVARLRAAISTLPATVAST